jgi:hypothetical protein
MPEADPANSDPGRSVPDQGVTTIDLTAGTSGTSTVSGNPAAATTNVPPANATPANQPPAQPTWNVSTSQQPRIELSPYIAEKQQDYVRLTFTVGLLLMFAWVIVWASIESASWPSHWEQTKDMLQIILPALTGLIGSVSGFYFGSRSNSKPGG